MPNLAQGTFGLIAAHIGRLVLLEVCFGSVYLFLHCIPVRTRTTKETISHWNLITTPKLHLVNKSYNFALDHVALAAQKPLSAI